MLLAKIGAAAAVLIRDGEPGGRANLSLGQRGRLASGCPVATIQGLCVPDERRNTVARSILLYPGLDLGSVLRAGAAGFSSSHSPTHFDSADRPIPSRLSSLAELERLVEAAGHAARSGSIAYLPLSAVGGITPECTKIGALFYKQALDTVVPVGSTRVAEMVKLLENTFRMINIGLVNEIAVMCDRMYS